MDPGWIEDGSGMDRGWIEDGSGMHGSRMDRGWIEDVSRMDGGWIEDGLIDCLIPSQALQPFDVVLDKWRGRRPCVSNLNQCWGLQIRFLHKIWSWSILEKYFGHARHMFGMCLDVFGICLGYSSCLRKAADPFIYEGLHWRDLGIKKRSNTQSLNQSINQTTNQSFKQTINHSMNQTHSHLIIQSNQQSLNQSVNLSITQSTNQSTN